MVVSLLGKWICLRKTSYIPNCIKKTLFSELVKYMWTYDHSITTFYLGNKSNELRNQLSTITLVPFQQPFVGYCALIDGQKQMNNWRLVTFPMYQVIIRSVNSQVYQKVSLLFETESEHNKSQICCSTPKEIVTLALIIRLEFHCWPTKLHIYRILNVLGPSFFVMQHNNRPCVDGLTWFWQTNSACSCLGLGDQQLDFDTRSLTSCDITNVLGRITKNKSYQLLPC
jgi:hypothetical protein